MGKPKRFNSYDDDVDKGRKIAHEFGMTRQRDAGLSSSFATQPRVPPIATVLSSAEGTGDGTFCSSSMAADQTTNISATNHIEFDTLDEDGGITLQTGTGQSDGIFELKAGKKYYLSASVRPEFSGATGQLVLAWYDRDNTTEIGKRGIYESQTNTSNNANQPNVESVFTPTANVEVELRIISVTALTALANEYCNATIYEIALGGSSGVGGGGGGSGVSFPITPTINDHGTKSSGTTTLDLSATNGHIHKITLGGNITIAFSNPPASGTQIEFEVELVQDATGGREVTWPASVVETISISQAASATTIITFRTNDGGTTYHAIPALRGSVSLSGGTNFANTSLSNLTTTAINVDLNLGGNALVLGSGGSGNNQIDSTGGTTIVLGNGTEAFRWTDSLVQYGVKIAMENNRIDMDSDNDTYLVTAADDVLDIYTNATKRVTIDLNSLDIHGNDLVLSTPSSDSKISTTGTTVLFTSDGTNAFRYTDSIVQFDLDSRTAAGKNIHIQGTGATGYLKFDEITTPSAPSANEGILYSKDDGGTTKLYFQDSAGTETDLLASELSAGDTSITIIDTGSNGTIINTVDGTQIFSIQDTRIDVGNSVPFYGVYQINMNDGATGDTVITQGAQFLTFNADSGGGFDFEANSVRLLRIGQADLLVTALTPNTTSPAITLFRDDATTPAADDIVADINFDGNNSVGTKTTFADIWGVITTVTSGSEDGRIIMNTMESGTKRTAMDIRPGLTYIEKESSVTADVAELRLKKIDASPIAADNVGQLTFVIEDTGVETQYAAILGAISDVTDAGSIGIQVRANNSLATAVNIEGDDNNAQYYMGFKDEFRMVPITGNMAYFTRAETGARDFSSNIGTSGTLQIPWINDGSPSLTDLNQAFGAFDGAMGLDVADGDLYIRNDSATWNRYVRDSTVT